MEAIYIVLGWLLGICGTLIVDKVQSHRRGNKLKKAIITELRLLISKVIAGNYQITSRVGNFDKKYLQWIIELDNKYPISGDSPAFSDALKNMIKNDENTIKLWAAEERAAYKGGLGLKRYTIPLIEANINDLAIFSPECSRKILGILARVKMANKEMDDAEYYLRMTFEPGLKGDNFK